MKENEEKSLATAETPEGTVASFRGPAAYKFLQRQAALLAASKMVPISYQGNMPNCAIALEIAGRIGASPIAVMQNLYIIKGNPSWSSKFIIGVINASKRPDGSPQFSKLRYKITGKGEDKECYAYATDMESGECLEGPPATMKMAEQEGWIDKSGSKWKTMPDLMLHYRAAAFFGRLYAPEILMGMLTADEAHDIAENVTVVVDEEPKDGTHAGNIVKGVDKEEDVVDVDSVDNEELI